MKKITLLTSIGAGLEYYDFMVYGLLANYIAKLFFPAANYYAGIMGAFSIFAIGYFVRPIGGIVFGIFGDRFGRKKTFLFSVALMAAATFAIGLLPTYANFGFSATMIFTCLRIAQGISLGAELPGSLTFLIEHVSGKSRGAHCGFMVASVGIGATLASFVIFIMAKLLTHDQIVAWGWRIPFLLGGILGIVGYLIRRKTTETPYFLQLDSYAKCALIELLRKHSWQIIRGIGIIIFPACLIIFVFSMPVYLQQIYHYPEADIYFVITCGYIWSAILLPLFGWWSDRIGRKRLLVLSSLLFALFSYFLFKILALGTFPALLIFMLLYQLIIAVLAASYFAMLAEGFPTRVRFTGVAFCYNIAYAVASLTPLAMGYLYKIYNHPNSIILFFIILALITAVSGIFCRNLLFERR